MKKVFYPRSITYLAFFTLLYKKKMSVIHLIDYKQHEYDNIINIVINSLANYARHCQDRNRIRQMNNWSNDDIFNFVVTNLTDHNWIQQVRDQIRQNNILVYSNIHRIIYECLDDNQRNQLDRNIINNTNYKQMLRDVLEIIRKALERSFNQEISRNCNQDNYNIFFWNES